jgi:hypothetical protein
MVSGLRNRPSRVNETGLQVDGLGLVAVLDKEASVMRQPVVGISVKQEDPTIGSFFRQ